MNIDISIYFIFKDEKNIVNIDIYSITDVFSILKQNIKVHFPVVLLKNILKYRFCLQIYVVNDLIDSTQLFINIQPYI